MGLKIDGIAASQHLDSSGEVLDIKGHDISDLVEGKGVLNFEHENGKPDDIIGHIIYAKKIFSEKDCENERQKKYWDSVKKPFVYIIAELFDDEEHPGAVAAAAMIRYYAKRKEKLLAGFSIEGSTLERKGNHLVRSVGRRVALTLRPCNKTCIADLLEDDKYKDIVKKSLGKSEGKHLVEVDTVILDSAFYPNLNKFEALKLALVDLQKTLSAGNGNVAPAQAVSGSALSGTKKAKKKTVIPDEIKTKVLEIIKQNLHTPKKIREIIKAALPEVADEYLDHFENLAEDLALKKGLRPLIRLTNADSIIPLNDSQSQILNGLYVSSETPDYPTTKHIEKAKNDKGMEALVRIDDTIDEDKRNRALAYYDVAHNLFNMGDVVPTIVFASNPKVHGGKPMYITYKNWDASPIESKERAEKMKEEAKKNGLWHKILLMDTILGMDRDGITDTMIGADNTPRLIDNHKAFDYSSITPSGIARFSSSNPLNEPPENILPYNVEKWLESIDGQKLVQILKKYTISQEAIAKAFARLRLLQHLLQEKKPINYLLNKLLELEENINGILVRGSSDGNIHN